MVSLDMSAVPQFLKATLFKKPAPRVSSSLCSTLPRCPAAGEPRKIQEGVAEHRAFEVERHAEVAVS